ncbi:pyridoxal-dependent decarboxylase [Archangium lipolyticum]|uniref:pyridoxal-dependent decarboxylase n=1 Tax=Archangium lipolyticum TaxID=2970465 RepID=UPI00214A3818|nr:pyridoxal-dependent decarboxylase [Archangium lipolyticum]
MATLVGLTVARKMSRGLAARPSMFSEYGVQLSRGFRALKVWMSLKAYGAAKYGRLIEQNVEQAHLLGRRVDAEPELQRLAPVSLNITRFRYVCRGAPEARLDAWNRELLCRLHESGVAVPSYTTLEGRYCLRVCFNNHPPKIIVRAAGGGRTSAQGPHPLWPWGARAAVREPSGSHCAPGLNAEFQKSMEYLSGSGIRAAWMAYLRQRSGRCLGEHSGAR